LFSKLWGGLKKPAKQTKFQRKRNPSGGSPSGGNKKTTRKGGKELEMTSFGGEAKK